MFKLYNTEYQDGGLVQPLNIQITNSLLKMELGNTDGELLQTHSIVAGRNKLVHLIVPFVSKHICSLSRQRSRYNKHRELS
jgi:hypothetical protein